MRNSKAVEPEVMSVVDTAWLRMDSPENLMVIKQKITVRVLKVNCDNEGIEKANQVIKRGGIVIFPTDTVYGIGCDPYNEKSVEKIYKIKSRDIAKPVPVLAYSIETASRICHIDKFTKKIAQKFWPGPLTIMLKVTN